MAETQEQKHAKASEEARKIFEKNANVGVIADELDETATTADKIQHISQQAGIATNDAIAADDGRQDWPYRPYGKDGEYHQPESKTPVKG